MTFLSRRRRDGVSDPAHVEVSEGVDVEEVVDRERDAEERRDFLARPGPRDRVRCRDRGVADVVVGAVAQGVEQGVELVDAFEVEVGHLDFEANVEVDITAADGLRDLHADLAARGVRLGLARVKHDLRLPLERAGLADLIGDDMLFPTLPVAEEAYVAWAASNPAPSAAATTGSPEPTPDTGCEP
jgi:phosphoglycolate phosphatase-like HAD superfamily hydrolase